jgi:CRP-like cAMP-binding protein
VKCPCKLSRDKRICGLPGQLQPRFFSGLTKTETDSILLGATHRLYPTSTVVLHQEDPADRFFLLTNGQGSHFVITDNGQKVMLNWLTPGQIFGGAAIPSTPSRYLASTEVAAGTCALEWDRKTIRECVGRDPRLLDNLLSISITEHLGWLVSAKVSLSADDAPGRIARLLISLASAIGKANSSGIEIRVGNEDLAASANVTPFTISRSLRAWQRKGLLKKGRGKILLKRPELLLVPG